MNYSILKIEILQAMRSTLSQKELSQKLGYSYSISHRWESHRKILRWADFCDICDALKLPLRSTCRSQILFIDDDLKSPFFVKSLIIPYLGNSTVDAISKCAQVLNTHPSVVKRWISGTVSPDFESILKLLDLKDYHLVSFLDKLVPVDQLSTLRNRAKKEKAEMNIQARIPYVASILCALDLKDYRELHQHSDYMIADKTNIPLTEVQYAIAELKNVGLIIEKNGKYEPNFEAINTEGLSDQNKNQINRYWIQKSLNMYNSPDDLVYKKPESPSVFSYRVIPMSKKMMNMVTQKIHTFHQEILALQLADTEPSEEVRIIMIHHYGLEEVPK